MLLSPEQKYALLLSTLAGLSTSIGGAIAVRTDVPQMQTCTTVFPEADRHAAPVSASAPVPVTRAKICSYTLFTYQCASVIPTLA